MKRLVSLFLAGLATLLPLILSLYLIYWLVTFMDGLLDPLLILILGKAIPGLGFLITITSIILVGLMATNIIGHKLIAWSEQIFVKIPLLGKMYATFKRITNSFFSSNKTSFRQVALVEFPRKGIYSLGFITNDCFPYIDEDTYSIFIPTTPNPTSGWFIIMSRDNVKILDISVEKGIEMVISAGMVNNLSDK